ncbi:hypothetical protein [Candidatus Tokpelaia sp.]|nr:hypothetical protein [Candidatus Tokpelaia sp.]
MAKYNQDVVLFVPMILPIFANNGSEPHIFLYFSMFIAIKGHCLGI